MSYVTKVRVPDLGDFADVPVITVLVAAGDVVAENDALLELESDKATMEVPAPFAGTVAEVQVCVGDRVSTGDLIMKMVGVDDTGRAAAPDEHEPQAKPSAPTAASVPGTGAASTAPAPPDTPPYAGPSVRKYARELGVNLTQISGTGPKGRIVREDVQSLVKRAVTALQAPASSVAVGTQGALAFDMELPAWPEPEYGKYGPVEEVTLSRIKTISGPALTRNAIVIPHVTNFDKADITDTEAFRKRVNERNQTEGIKLTIISFMLHAAVAALKAYPDFNCSFAGGKLIRKRYYHIGFAADTPGGLVVPVIRDCDRKSILEIAAEIQTLSAKARGGKLTPADMSGGCFTVSSLGGIGGTGFTPIINAPEVAILGAGRAEIRPVWNGDAFVPRLIQPLTLSWDHRAVDGAAAARFLGHMAAGLGDIRRMAL